MKMIRKQPFLQMKHRKYLTLLETLIGVFLIGVIASFMGMKLNKALYKHEYENNIKKFDGYVEFCKKMAFANQADIYMQLFQDEKKTEIEIGTSTDMGFFKNIKKSHDTFKNMIFEFNKEKPKNIEIIFTSNGNILNQGELMLVDIKKKFKKNITIKI